jgi:hypothetical protein
MLRILTTPILIDWKAFQPETSFFIPCLDYKPVQEFVEKEAFRLRMQVVCKRVVERGKYGLRVWRLA